ncbi:hypothetical protein Tco_0916580 [Tanacetum coccineum]
MESRLGRGSWQLPVAIVRFPGSSDPGEARHIERRGSIPSRQPVLLPVRLSYSRTRTLRECSSPEDPSLRPFLYLPLVGRPPESTVALTKCHSASSEMQVKVDKKAPIEQGIMESRLGRGSWQLPVAIVRFPGSSDPDEACHIERRVSIVD